MNDAAFPKPGSRLVHTVTLLILPQLPSFWVGSDNVQAGRLQHQQLESRNVSTDLFLRRVQQQAEFEV